MDILRNTVRMLCGPREFETLYCGELFDTRGSKSQVPTASPLMVLYCIQIAVCRCGDIHGLASPKYGIFVSHISSIMHHFQEMDRIDKTQFPFPYAQVTKMLCLLYVNILPFVLQPRAQNFTEFITALV